MKKKTVTLFAVIALVAIWGQAPAIAAPTVINSFTAWSILTGTYQNVDLSSYYTPSPFNTVGTINLPYNETLQFNQSVEVRLVGPSWISQWSSDNRTPYVLYPGYDVNSITGTFGPSGDFPSAFGFFAQPNRYGTFQIELILPDGTTLTQNALTGDPGEAEFFGWIGGAVTSFTITALPDANNISPLGFAFGEMVKGPPAVPEPGTLILLGSGLLGLVAAGRKKFRK